MQKSLVLIIVLLFAIFLTPFATATAVNMTDLIITADENGVPSKDFKFGDTLSIQSAIRIENQAEQGFVFIVQVQDSAGRSVFISWTSGSLLDDDATPSVNWKPERPGTYTVQAFLWTSIDSPEPLSLIVQRFEIDVNNCQGSALCFSGIVTRITDGDTLRIDDIPIRLALINTPERGEAGYAEATAFTTATCPVGSTALVDEDDGQISGSYGRIVAKVYCGDKLLNEELLRAGHAQVYAQYCDDSEFGREEWVSIYC